MGPEVSRRAPRTTVEAGRDSESATVEETGGKCLLRRPADFGHGVPGALVSFGTAPLRAL